MFFDFFKNIIQVRSGSRRFVIIAKDKVYKIPKFTNWVSFIRGINENLEERYWWSADGSRKCTPKEPWRHKHLAEIFFADRFGFLVIMERVDTHLFRESFLMDLKELQECVRHYTFSQDLKTNNLGYRDNTLVVLDYGYFGGTMDCYIGT